MDAARYWYDLAGSLQMMPIQRKLATSQQTPVRLLADRHTTTDSQDA